LKIKTIIVSCHTADSKAPKQEVNGTVILRPLVFPDLNDKFFLIACRSGFRSYRRAPVICPAEMPSRKSSRNGFDYASSLAYNDPRLVHSGYPTYPYTNAYSSGSYLNG
jgi:hypothetical protein